MLVHRRQLEVVHGGERLRGELAVPSGAVGVVLVAYVSERRWQSPRQGDLARSLNEAALATLRLELRVLPEEFAEQWAGGRSGLERLASRLEAAREHLQRMPETAQFPQGCLGGGVGAAAVLLSAERRPEGLYALVCCRARTDLVEEELPRVRVPTLLVVGSEDEQGLPRSQRAQELLVGEKSLRLVPGAGPELEEPGAVEDVTRLAADWFRDHFRPVSESRIEGWYDEKGRWV